MKHHVEKYRKTRVSASLLVRVATPEPILPEATFISRSFLNTFHLSLSAFSFSMHLGFFWAIPISDQFVPHVADTHRAWDAEHEFNIPAFTDFMASTQAEGTGKNGRPSKQAAEQQPSTRPTNQATTTQPSLPANRRPQSARTVCSSALEPKFPLFMCEGTRVTLYIFGIVVPLVLASKDSASALGV